MVSLELDISRVIESRTEQGRLDLIQKIKELKALLDVPRLYQRYKAQTKALHSLLDQKDEALQKQKTQQTIGIMEVKSEEGTMSGTFGTRHLESAKTDKPMK